MRSDNLTVLYDVKVSSDETVIFETSLTQTTSLTAYTFVFLR